MTLYRFAARRNLFDTTMTSPSDLDYTKANGDRWPISEVDYNLLDALNDAISTTRFVATDDLDVRAKAVADAVVETTLASRGEPAAGWSTTVNSSQPSGGHWNDQSLQRWIHITHVEDQTEGIVASPYATIVNHEVIITWRVVSIQVEEVVD